MANSHAQVQTNANNFQQNTLQDIKFNIKSNRSTYRPFFQEKKQKIEASNQNQELPYFANTLVQKTLDNQFNEQQKNLKSQLLQIPMIIGNNKKQINFGTPSTTNYIKTKKNILQKKEYFKQFDDYKVEYQDEIDGQAEFSQKESTQNYLQPKIISNNISSKGVISGQVDLKRNMQFLPYRSRLNFKRKINLNRKSLQYNKEKKAWDLQHVPIPTQLPQQIKVNQIRSKSEQFLRPSTDYKFTGTMYTNEHIENIMNQQQCEEEEQHEHKEFKNRTVINIKLLQLQKTNSNHNNNSDLINLKSSNRQSLASERIQDSKYPEKGKISPDKQPDIRVKGMTRENQREVLQGISIQEYSPESYRRLRTGFKQNRVIKSKDFKTRQQNFIERLEEQKWEKSPKIKNYREQFFKLFQNGQIKEIFDKNAEILGVFNRRSISVENLSNDTKESQYKNILQFPTSENHYKLVSAKINIGSKLQLQKKVNLHKFKNDILKESDVRKIEDNINSIDILKSISKSKSQNSRDFLNYQRFLQIKSINQKL